MAATRLEKARRAFVYTTDVAVGFIAVTLVIRLVWAAREGEVTVPLAVVAGVCDLGVCALFARFCRAAMRSAPRPTLELALAGLLAATALVLSPRGDAGAAGLVWSGMAALYLPVRGVVVAAVLVVTAITAYVDFAVGNVSWWVNAVTVGAQVAGLCALMRVWLFLWRLLKEAHQAQDAKAMLAVSEERLRFARDLHDLLGHSLSVITVKSELASKLAGKDPEKAADEMAEVRRLAKESLREVRATVQGYRSLDLDTELANVRSVLEAAGVDCDVTGDGQELSEPSRALLAWVIREGATNLLKHSTASSCAISITGAVLEMRNDGVHKNSDGAGSGLDGLAERIAAAGGGLTTASSGGEFLLRAEVPG